MPRRTEQGSGRGTFDRDDLKEAAGGAGRAMEPLACFFGFEAGDVNSYERKDVGKSAFEAFEKGGGAGNGLEGRVVVTWSGFGRQADTQVGPRPRARDSAAGFATAYELSRGLHRKANWRAVRFGPIRISPLQ